MSLSQDVFRVLCHAITQGLKLCKEEAHFGTSPQDPENIRTQRLFRILFDDQYYRRWDFREAVIEAVTVCGLSVYDQVVERGLYPDHSDSPSALAYVMKIGRLTCQQIEAIHFDHETPDQFMRQASNLIDNVLMQLGRDPRKSS